MAISRLARTHLVYQFLLLTLVFIGVGYYELLLEKRFVMLLLVVPTFLYQLLVISCCTEVIPLPRWMDLSDDANRERNNGISHLREEGTKKQNNEVSAMSTEPNNLNNESRNLKVCARKYTIRNCKSSISETSSLQPAVPVTAHGKNRESPLGCNNSTQIQNPEPTKTYFFPYRQKRLEQWIDPKENSRPFKIRNWQSNANLDESSTMPITSNNSSDVSPIKNLADSSIPEECSVIPESELIKRYTFPFRQKHSFEFGCDELDNAANLPPTPYWRTAGYSLAVKQEARRRRRSVSSSLLTTRHIDWEHESEKSKDFSQSVEISRSPINESRRNTSSPSTFSKMKVGFVSCLSKMKRVNSKNNFNKGFSNKKRSFKSMFQSRENINLESMEKECRSKSKDGVEESNCDFYPSYIPFQKERFETDVRKRMLELPKN